jgi:hypothetical protein
MIHAGPARNLRSEERSLIAALLSISHREKLKALAPEIQARDLQDGGMGSIRFDRGDPRHFGQEIARAEYQDMDGILVSITLNIDDRGELFELDIWKVDSSPLKRFPKPSDFSVTG